MQESCVRLEAWGKSVKGLTKIQCLSGMKLIAEGKTEFQRFPPNPQEFRNLCLTGLDNEPSFVPFIKGIEHKHVNNLEGRGRKMFLKWEKAGRPIKDGKPVIDKEDEEFYQECIERR